MLGAMNAFGVKPSVVTFNASISVCGKAGNVEEAMRVFGAMNDFAVKLSAVTFKIEDALSACLNFFACLNLLPLHTLTFTSQVSYCFIFITLNDVVIVISL